MGGGGGFFSVLSDDFTLRFSGWLVCACMCIYILCYLFFMAF